MVEYSLVPPEVLMGEGGMCGFWAMVAIAQLVQRNNKMNGWQDQPNLKAVLAAILWPAFPDMTQGAHYVFSLQDLENQKVRQIIKDKKPKVVWPCSVGQLAFY